MKLSRHTLLLLTVLGCAHPSASIQENTVNESPAKTAVQRSDATHTIELIDAGRPPRLALRYYGQVGETVTFSRKEAFRLENYSKFNRETEIKYRMQVEEIGDNGELSVLYRWLEPSADGAPARPVEVRATYLNTGRTLRWVIFIDGVSPQEDSQLYQRALRLVARTFLPKEPVGIGAVWEISTKGGPQAPIKLQRNVKMTLTEMNGKQVTLERSASVKAEKQPFNNGTLLYQRVNVSALMSFDFAAPTSLIARSSTFQSTTEQAIKRSSGVVIKMRGHDTIEEKVLNKP